MSKIVYVGPGLRVDQYVGPEIPFTIGNAAEDRRRYQITNTETGMLITIDHTQLAALQFWLMDLDIEILTEVPEPAALPESP